MRWPRRPGQDASSSDLNRLNDDLTDDQEEKDEGPELVEHINDLHGDFDIGQEIPVKIRVLDQLR